ncbi:hypothetical protein AB0J43_53345, partial [Nonomuraea fuscirosea]
GVGAFALLAAIALRDRRHGSNLDGDHGRKRGSDVDGQPGQERGSDLDGNQGGRERLGRQAAL